MGSSWSGEKKRLKSEIEARDAEVALLKARLDALEKPKKEKDVVMEEIIPFTNQALLGSTLGWASGYTLRVLGRAAGFAVGTSFMLVQGLSYLGYLQVDWRKVERDYLKSLDRDGDGEVTADDMKQIWRDASDVLAFNLPAGTGFTAGLLYGLNVAPAQAAGIAAVSGLGARILLPRVALGGATATGLPAIFVAAKKRFELPEDDSTAQYNENTAMDN